MLARCNVTMFPKAGRCLDCLSHSGRDIFIHAPRGYRYVNASYGATTVFRGSERAHRDHLSRSRVRPLAFLRDEIRKRLRNAAPGPATPSTTFPRKVRRESNRFSSFFAVFSSLYILDYRRASVRVIKSISLCRRDPRNVNRRRWFTFIDAPGPLCAT